MAESIRRNDSDELTIEGHGMAELVREHGSPLYVLSAAAIRANYRRLHDAFARQFESVEVLYSVKASPQAAVCALLAGEGAGAEVYSEGEMAAALNGGFAAPSILVHDAFRPDSLVEAAIRGASPVAIDSLRELERVSSIAAGCGVPAKGVLRVRLDLAALAGAPNEWNVDGGVGESIVEYKLGADRATSIEVIEQASRSETVDLEGIHFHLGRWSNRVDYHTAMVSELVDWVDRLAAETGWLPHSVNVGGGFVHGRPEGAGPHGADTDVAAVEKFAAGIGEEFRRSPLEHLYSTRGHPFPTVKVEPGRYLVQNAGVLLTTVGEVRSAAGRTFVLVDASGQHLPAVESPQGWYYHPEVVQRSSTPPGPSQETIVAGRGCGFELLARGTHLGQINEEDILCFMDAGAYTESKAANINLVPRPPLVLVDGETVSLISAGETLHQVLARQHVPAYLLDAARAEL